MPDIELNKIIVDEMPDFFKTEIPAWVLNEIPGYARRVVEKYKTVGTECNHLWALTVEANNPPVTSSRCKRCGILKTQNH